MLIDALCAYYDILAKANSNMIPPEKYRFIKITHCVCLSEDGKVDDIIDLRTNDKKGKPVVPVKRTYPDEQTISAIKSVILDYRPQYVFGLMIKDGKYVTVAKKHQAYKNINEAFFGRIKETNALIKAFNLFLSSWNPNEETNNKALGLIKADYTQAQFTFALSGKPNEELQENENIKELWENGLYEIMVNNSCEIKNECAVTGKYGSIAKTHDKIMGSGTGVSLINIKQDSMISYGNSAGKNSSISFDSMKKYTTVLNCMKQSKMHHKFIKGTDVFFWAMNNTENEVKILRRELFISDEEDTLDAYQVNQSMASITNNTSTGMITKNDLDNNKYDPNVDFYIVGIDQTKGRFAIKWIVKNKFASIMESVAEFQHDLGVVPADCSYPTSISNVLSGLISTKASNSVVPANISSSMYSSVFKGKPLPYAVLCMAVNRLKTDHRCDNINKASMIEITKTRVKTVKACIVRYNRDKGQKEELNMALDLNNTNPYYLCGRLFAVLEKMQIDSAPDLNRTIKEAYFASAASTPAMILPKLINLSNHHARKLNESAQVYYSKLIGSIIDMVNGEFPKTADIPSQGMFMVGYYQQKEDLYISKSKAV
ncbi:type I-C CRISPR-associated protein Cas8c/Csd1 [Aminicella lysinilytica]|uniref:type I-C CRISPR-associated protein Cas8c/Csd1 n=1 Tax=Aminicella lysinilytica TaxID=433323 RepID=UPI0026EEC8EF|nr:type I-C CRISPR-associated protein Cas8c/Csd1 [Aminicella lysinilytica]